MRLSHMDRGINLEGRVNRDGVTNGHKEELEKSNSMARINPVRGKEHFLQNYDFCFQQVAGNHGIT